MDSPILLTKLEKKVLKYCNAHNPENGNQSADIMAGISCDSLYELYMCCEELNKNGYLNDFAVFLDGSFVLELSHKGTHYKERSRLEVKQFIFRSMVVPVGVSIATTGLLWLINKILL